MLEDHDASTSLTAARPYAAPSEAPGRPRLAGAAVALPSGGLLAVGAALTPSEAGHGTHTQMGLPPCQWVTAFNKPCPTCGMTTAVTRAANGDLGGSFLAQPAGMGLALVAAVVFWCGLHGMATGAATVSVAAKAWSPRLLWVAGAVLLAAWLFKLATFDGSGLGGGGS
ncbi:MAG: DUF2752 domain-containing protein [Planctomycetota bacterium]